LNLEFEEILITNDRQKEYYVNRIYVINSKIREYEEKKAYNPKGYNAPRGFIFYNLDKSGEHHVK
jgi:hypothetical protein